MSRIRGVRWDRGRRAAGGVGRLRAGSGSLALYHRRLPVVDLRPTTSPMGKMIAEHFAIRAEGRFRYRRAQGVLALPADFADYMRGRHRQAVRTNVGHARRAGITVISCAIDNWAPGLDDSRRPAITPGPIERWTAFSADGTCAGDAILSVDRDVALLHGLASFAPQARWLLHTAIVERLCGDCAVLVTNSDDAYRLGPGTQHFQRLLGYEVRRLRLLDPVAAPPAELPPQPAGLDWPPTAQTCGIVGGSRSRSGRRYSRWLEGRSGGGSGKGSGADRLGMQAPGVSEATLAGCGRLRNARVGRICGEGREGDATFVKERCALRTSVTTSRQADRHSFT